MAEDTWGRQTGRQQLQCAVFEGTFGSGVGGAVLSALAAPMRQTLAQLADLELGFLFWKLSPAKVHVPTPSCLAPRSA